MTYKKSTLEDLTLFPMKESNDGSVRYIAGYIKYKNAGGIRSKVSTMKKFYNLIALRDRQYSNREFLGGKDSIKGLTLHIDEAYRFFDGQVSMKKDVDYNKSRDEIESSGFAFRIISSNKKITPQKIVDLIF